MVESTVTTENTDQPLLTGSFMQMLDRLDVLSRKILAGKLQGERRGKRTGQSVEFADYRPYIAGDDLRWLDWNLYARLDRLFLRLFTAEEDLAVSILLDTTHSMDWGQPNKLLYAKRLCAALGYVGLVHQNRLSVYSFSDRLVDRLINLRGRRPVGQLVRFLQAQTVQPAGDLGAACRAFALAGRQKSVVILISDFLDKGRLDDALRYVTSHQSDVYAIQILSPQEIRPESGSLTGDLRLVDCEDSQRIDVSVGPAMLRRYRARLNDHREQLRFRCLRRGIDCLSVNTSEPVETVVLRTLRTHKLLG